MFASQCNLILSGAFLGDEIKSQLLGSLRTVPKTIFERGRQAVDLIAEVQGFQRGSKSHGFHPLTLSNAGAISASSLPC